MSKKEKHLQAEIVTDFSQKKPKEKNLLWATINRSLNIKDGMAQRAAGVKRGVSDLIYFKFGSLIGIELKFPGERHKRQHIENQLSWGKSIIAEGGEYFIVTSLVDFWEVINGNGYNVNSVYKLDDIELLLESGKSTIVF